MTRVPRDQDCGKEITFKARADCVSGTKDILVSVVKIEFSELKNTDGNPQWRQSTDPVGTAGHYLSASTNFTGKVKLTPAPPTKDDIPYEIQLSQYQNTHEVERYRTANPTVSETVEDDKKKRDDAFDKVKQNVTYDYNGVLTVTGEDEPGAFIPDSRLDKLIFVTTEFYFNLYLEWRCKADSDGLWIPLGLLFWEWNGEAARDNTGAIAPNGPIFPSDGKSYSGTEKPPNKPQ